MSYRFQLAGPAQRYFRRLDRSMQQRIARRLEQLADDPLSDDLSKSLHGLGDLRSSRVGDYRIVFSVDTEAQTVQVARIGPRGDVYSDL